MTEARTDTAAIRRLVAQARRRIRVQAAFEGATTATILAAAGALASVFAMRIRAVSPTVGLALLAASGAVIAVGAIWAATRPLRDETIARRIDRASGLADRLSTAIAFETQLRAPAEGEAVETRDLMIAAIRDGVRAAPRADVRAATRFKAPRDGKAALGFLAVAAIAAGLAVPNRHPLPHLLRAEPDRGGPGATVQLVGTDLTEGLRPSVESVALGTTGAPVPTHKAFIPANGAVYLGGTPAQGGVAVTIVDWTSSTITIRIPDTAKTGPSKLVAVIDEQLAGPVPFVVLAPDDVASHPEGNFEPDADEQAYIDSLLGQLEQASKDNGGIKELDDFVAKLRKLLKDAKEGKISKEKFLDELAAAQQALEAHPEPKPDEVAKQLENAGKELEKQTGAAKELTKDLAEALKKNDMQKAQDELNKLAEKLDDKSMTEQQKQDLAKQLDQVSKEMKQEEQQQEKKDQDEQKKDEDEIRRLQKEKDQAKTEREKQDAERRLEKKKDDLQKLQKEQQQKDQSAQREAVKRLQRDMEKSAEDLQQKKPESGTKEDQQQQDQQASQKLKDAARETGRVDEDRRKQATEKKVASQMEDLREALRRAKQKQNKGPQDPFNKQQKNQDYAQRASGHKRPGQGGQGQSGPWKPGQGQQGQGGQGQGQQAQNGQGQGQGQGSGQGSGQPQQGGQEAGVGHDDHLTDDPTAKGGYTKDEEIQGTQGASGSSTRETILSAAQKGFASTKYQKVYADYQKIVENVMRTEKLPASYKYFVKRYFAKIHPSTEATP
ncbi:MAG TPA: hypothetical protein VGM88_17925 [Kofleriaceae bacterium]